MINQVVSRVLAKWSKFICEQVEREWSNKSLIEGNKEIHFELNNIISNMVVSTISASGGAAWIMEYGSGHLLDTNNPYLDEYKKSDKFNNDRTSEGYEFLGRKKGDIVYRPDGTTYESEGRAEGLHLEREMGGKPPLKAVLPMHIIEEQIKIILPEIIADIQLAVKEDIVKQLTISYQVRV